MNVLVSGLINVETTLKIREFPINYYPIDYPFFGINTRVSGVALNVAKALRSLGDDVTLASIQANDFDSERILDEVRSAGIDTRYINREMSTSPSSVVLYDGSGRRQIHCDLKDLQERTYENHGLDQALDGCDLAVICNIGFNRALLRRARAKGKIIATDVHVLGDVDDPYNREFLEGADIVFLSDERVPGDPREFIGRLAARYGTKIIVLGQGSRGAMLHVRDEDAFHDLEPVSVGPVVNSVGAGDSLFSAFLHFHAKGLAPVEALKRAEIFASYKIGFDGASVGFLREEEVEALYRQVEVKVRRLP